jgi:hypothetical protein
MSELIIKKFSSPEERRPFVAHGHADILRFGDSSIGLAVFEPGWKWTQDVQPLAGTRSCEAPHFCYIVSGRLAVVMDDGTRGELDPGDVALIPPGHDAWVIGDEPFVMLDFEGMSAYAQARKSAQAREKEQAAPATH